MRLLLRIVLLSVPFMSPMRSVVEFMVPLVVPLFMVPLVVPLLMVPLVVPLLIVPLFMVPVWLGIVVVVVVVLGVVCAKAALVQSARAAVKIREAFMGNVF